MTAPLTFQLLALLAQGYCLARAVWALLRREGA